MRPAECSRACDVERLARAMYGGVGLAGRQGVVHVTALWDPPEGSAAGGGLRTMRIGERTPKSEHDYFALNLARARADAILVTGKVLRDEPTLRYDLAGACELPTALAAWRRRVIGCREPPWLLVLTTGRRLDLGHPALHGWARPLIYTSERAAVALRERVRAAGSELLVVGVERPSARGAVEHLRDATGARVISVEAGPTSTGALYAQPLLVHEVMLSRYRGERLAPGVQGPRFILSRAQLESRLGVGTPPYEVLEPSGPWRFERIPWG